MHDDIVVCFKGGAGDIWALQNIVLQTSECFYGQSPEDKSSTAIDAKLDNSKQSSTNIKKSKNVRCVYCLNDIIEMSFIYYFINVH